MTEFMYVTLPDGSQIRGPITLDPTFGFPTTPPLSEWERVPEDAEEQLRQ